MAAAREPRFHHYSPTPGLPELREAIAHKTKRDSGVDCAAEQVLVTNGGKHAVYNTFQVLCDPGDEVLLPAPYWTSYPECITLGGGVPVVLPTTEADGFRVSIEQLEAAVHAAHEGAAVRLAEQPDRRGVSARRGRGDRALGARARHLGRHRRDLRAPHLRRSRCSRRCPALVPELAEQCVILNGVAKTYAMTGWRVGWMIGPRDVIARGHQPAVALHVERLERRAGRRARRGVGRPRRGRRDARGVRAAAAS